MGRSYGPAIASMCRSQLQTSNLKPVQLYVFDSKPFFSANDAARTELLLLLALPLSASGAGCDNLHHGLAVCRASSAVCKACRSAPALSASARAASRRDSCGYHNSRGTILRNVNDPSSEYCRGKVSPCIAGLIQGKDVSACPYSRARV